MPLTALIFGILGASLALVIELVVLNLGGSLSSSTLLPNFSNLSTLALVALIEEGSRYLLLRQYLIRLTQDTLCSWQQALLTGLAFGIGFASIELVFLFSIESTPLFPIIGIALVHVVLSVLFALSLTKNLPLPAVLVFVFGVALHFAYNFLLTILT